MQKFEVLDIEEAIPQTYRLLLNTTDEGMKAVKVIEILTERNNKLTELLNESLAVVELAKKNLQAQDMQKALELKNKAENHLLFGWLGF